MSDQESLIVQGQLAELKHKAADLEIKLRGLRKSLRINLNEFTPLEDLDFEAIGSEAISLAAGIIDYREMLEQIRAMKKALGR